VLWKTTWSLGVAWIALVLYLLLQETPAPRLIALSLFFPAYYLLLSFYMEWHIRRTARQGPKQP